MRHLSKMLRATFQPARARRADPHRKARELAKELAQARGVVIEPLRDSGGGMNVWPPKSWAGPDPFEGDHFAGDWAAALVMVKVYAGEG